MPIDAAFVAVLAAALAGLALSVLIERLMTPRPPVVRPWAAWALHVGLWLSAHAVLTLVLGRPWFAAAAVSALLLVLVLVNNAKFKALREPFVFQDFEYFTDAIRHPRLYLPFLGWDRFLGATLGVAGAVAIGLYLEPVPVNRLSPTSQLGASLMLLAFGSAALWLGHRYQLRITFLPEKDVSALGFLPTLWRYGQEARQIPSEVSPFQSLPAVIPPDPLPHLVVVQSESFFDPRPLFAGIRPELLAEFDRLKADAVAYGKLSVPAFGANTVRTEFAFLTGIPEECLGAHRFNPYRAIAAGWQPGSVASWLKRLGYRTVCIHPYPASFYQRDRVYPCLGFDHFIDIRAFDPGERSGPYIGDLLVAEKVTAMLREAREPLFLFVITMENHGPLHLEQVAQGDIERLYASPPPNGCDDLTIYLRHLRNADRMIACLRQALEQLERSACLCWFGDHVPIMTAVYEQLGIPGGETDYVIWSNRQSNHADRQRLPTHALAFECLRRAGGRAWGGALGFPR